MIVHLFAPSTFCQKVVIACAVKNVAVQEIHYDLFSTADERRADALTVWGRLPVAEIEGELVSESTSIAEVVDFRFEGPALIPGFPRKDARCRQVDRIADAYLLKQLGSLFHHRFGMHRPFSHEALAAICGQIWTTLSWLEAQLADAVFAAGDTMSLADCSVVPGINVCQQLGVLTHYPALASYHQRLIAREDVGSALRRIEQMLETEAAYETYRQKITRTTSEADLLHAFR